MGTVDVDEPGPCINDLTDRRDSSLCIRCDALNRSVGREKMFALCSKN